VAVSVRVGVSQCGLSAPHITVYCVERATTNLLPHCRFYYTYKYLTLTHLHNLSATLFLCNPFLRQISAAPRSPTAPNLSTCSPSTHPLSLPSYVAEMMTNRLLRFVQQPQGVYHASVFYQFSGMIGPSSLACDSNGNIYVGRYDLSSCSSRGAVSVISATGVAVAELSVPGPEVTGVALSKDETELYVTEASSNTIYRFQGECGSFYIGGQN